MRLAIFFVILSTLSLQNLVCSENILFILPLASKSHRNVFQPLISGMAGRGHQVTVASPYPSKDEKGVRELVPTDFARHMEVFGGDPIKKRRDGKMALFTQSFNFMFEGCEEVYRSKKFMELLKQKWDLIYLNAFMNDCMYGFVYKTKASFILVSTLPAPSSITSFTGNRLPPSFVPSVVLDFSDAMTFPQRIVNVLMNFLGEIFGTLVFIPKFEAVYKKYLGQDLPDIRDISLNVSAIFMNSHFTLTHPRPTLPDVQEVGGMHCRPAKPLPTDIEEFVKDAKDGFIFFSLGSIVQASTLPDNVRKIFMNVFGRLKQKVLWKWETGEMENLPSNVKLLKWAPQQDILGHENIKLFITHGGLLSTQEAAYHGVPLVGIPIFGDQDLNMKQAERAGYALAIEILDVTEDSLETTINRILNEKQFSARAAELSVRFRDQPQTPLERAIFWSEYIIRHKGLVKSAARNLNFYQYYSIDVILTLTALIVAVLWLMKVIVMAIVRLICCRGASKKNKVKSQ